MKSTFKKFIEFVLTIIFSIVIIYISLFTDIPTKTINVIKQKVEECSNKYEQYSKDFKINELSIRTNTYYYDLLTEDQKKIYSSIASGVKNFENEFVIRDYKAGNKDEFASEVSKAIEAFTNDHPEVFYLQSQYSSYIMSGFNGNIGYVKLNYTEETQEEVNKKIDIISQKVEYYLEGLDGLTELEKEIAIHDKLSYDVKYSQLEELPRAYHTIEGTFIENVGVCDSFTKSLQILYDRAGIDSIIVLGVLEGNAHAWNLVKIDNEWYHVDLTSSHSVYDETGIVNHAYFNINNDRLNKFSTIDNEDILPEVTSQENNYYKVNNLIITPDDNLYNRLNEICNHFKNDNYIEFYYDGDVSDVISSILVQLKKIDGSFLKESKMYYYNIQNAIIIPKN